MDETIKKVDIDDFLEDDNNEYKDKKEGKKATQEIKLKQVSFDEDGGEPDEIDFFDNKRKKNKEKEESLKEDKDKQETENKKEDQKDDSECVPDDAKENSNKINEKKCTEKEDTENKASDFIDRKKQNEESISDKHDLIREHVTKIGKSEFASSHTKEELNDYGIKKLNEISYTDEMAETLFPVVCQDLFGFKGVFIGDNGGLKGEFLDAFSNLLYDIGKTSTPEYEKIVFANMPETFELDVLYVIDDLNDAIINLFNLDDLSQTSSITQQSYRNKMEWLIRSPGEAYIILNATQTDIRGFLTLDARLPFLFGDRRVTFTNLSNEAIEERFEDALPEFHKKLLTPDVKTDMVSYLERNRRYFPFDNQELATYLANYTSRYESIVFPKEKYNDKTLEESFSSIVGMDVVKKQILELSEYLQIRQKLERANIKLPAFNLHMMFLGNPGVGKTTIARIIAKVLFDLGYIREEKLVEVTSKDLVSAYGNQTGVKTNKVIMQSMGGVLFVDEAYSLAQSCGASGLEAISNLVKAMEDYKDDLVCMFAGYSLEMQEFVRANSGISSRISYVFEFSDYTKEELFEIFKLKLKATGMNLDDGAIPQLMNLCKFAAGRRNFGNGRFIDKLLQRALTKHATLDLPEDKMLTLVKESIPEVEEVMASFGRFGT